MKKKIILMASLMLFALVVCSVNAIGINRDYLPDNTLKLHAGESAIYGVRLPNIGEEDMTVAFKVESTDDIAEVIDPQDTYLLPAGVLDTAVNIKIAVPKNVKVGAEYSVSLYTTEVGEGAGQVVFNTAAGTGFIVKVISEEETSTVIARTTGYLTYNPAFPTTLLIVLVAVCVVIGAGFVIYVKRLR